MGVELISHNSQAGNLHYSWKGWCWIREFARENGIDTGEFAEYNDGDELGEVSRCDRETLIKNNLREPETVDESDRVLTLLVCLANGCF